MLATKCLLVLSLGYASAQEWDACIANGDSGGVCIDTTLFSCSAATITGACGGGNNIRCCPPDGGAQVSGCAGGTCALATTCTSRGGSGGSGCGSTAESAGVTCCTGGGDAPTDPPTQSTNSLPAADTCSMARISASVGVGGTNNQADRNIVSRRLQELGYQVGNLDLAINVFQSAFKSCNRLCGDGRVDPGGTTEGWLRAFNAPGWGEMRSSGPGRLNIDTVADSQDFGTTWLNDVIDRAGAKCARVDCTYGTNDASYERGGDTPDHAGHEAGMNLDINLPRTNGGNGGITVSSSLYDRTRARNMLTFLKEDSLVTTIYLNDQTLINEGLCAYAGGHDNHIHINIKAPPQVACKVEANSSNKVGVVAAAFIVGAMSAFLQ
jgi:hypothetical protein